MKKLNIFSNIPLVSLLSTTLALAGGMGWITDLEEGLALAKKEGKPVLAEFTGSDWCPPCIMMQKKVFSKEEFVNAASKDYILVTVDSPRGDALVAQKNEPYFVKHSIQSVPSIVLFKPNGKEYDRFGAAEFPSIESFLNRIKK